MLRSLFLRERNSARRRNAGPRRYLIGVGQTTKGASKKDKKYSRIHIPVLCSGSRCPMGRQCQTFHTGEVREKLLTRPSTLPSDDLSRLDFLPFFCVGDEEEEEEIQSIFLHPRGPFWLFPPILLRTDQSPPPLLFQGSPSPTKVSFSNSHFFKRKVLAAAGIRTLSTLFPRGWENVFNRAPKGDTVNFFLQKFHLRHLECQCQGTTGTFRSCRAEPSVVRTGSVSTRRRSPGGKKT